MNAPAPAPKEENFLKRLDFLIFFAIYYYVMLNDDKLWQAQKELKL